MSRPENRLQLMERLGATQFNDRLAWCGFNESEKKVYFSIWTDKTHTHNGERGYFIQEPYWGTDATGKRNAPRRDQDAKISLVFDQGYQPLGYFIVAKNRTAHPREIAETRTSFVLRLQLERLPDGSIFASLRDRIPVN